MARVDRTGSRRLVVSAAAVAAMTLVAACSGVVLQDGVLDVEDAVVDGGREHDGTAGR
jgi:hypothetical protein